ncbi:Zn-dependent hydrolase [Roseibium aggregatum]|uniref:Zn-dependent hydrolase n=1 Tax=Roseibium aggregatum TaxID=187304 RepID=A0A939J1T7_9HYPH|nr:Zn-dependent hydrolase [Roseibium aggregatum]MBN9668817.1 Zn-dependent hydrolase [Roseibium aggregatum]
MSGDLSKFRIDADRLMGRIERLGEIGSLPGGGVCRLALTDEDKAGRDLVTGWMRDLGLDVSVDRIGNVWGIRAGLEGGPPVLLGSHIDTVATGGLYDGTLGVLAGLEVIATLNDAAVETRFPVAVAFFTNEEGSRFAPDMMGSAVHQGSLPLEEALAVVGIDGATVGSELQRIGYGGTIEPETLCPRAFLELHIEQGPVLEREGLEIGAVTGVQGISWTEYVLTGVSNHAGTTPMAYRHDAGLVAAEAIVAARRVTGEIGGTQVATVGSLKLEPNLVNVVPEKAVFTIDLRNAEEEALQQAEAAVETAIRKAAEAEGVTVASRKLARFEPVAFDERLVSIIEARAKSAGLSIRRMHSGAGHDAQMFAPNCPTAMIFVPSRDGLSHNIREYTAPELIAAGARILLETALMLASDEFDLAKDQEKRP